MYSRRTSLENNIFRKRNKPKYISTRYTLLVIYFRLELIKENINKVCMILHKKYPYLMHAHIHNVCV